MNNQVVFDDWIYRPKNILTSIKKDYFLCFIPIWMFTLISFVSVLFEIYLIFIFALAIFANIVLVFQYLKIKNNHLVITDNSIYVTNRFNKTKKYDINYKECVLEIKKSIKRSGGIWMKLYDKNKKLLLKYEDMINTPTMYGGKLLPFGVAIKLLEIPIIDNGLFDLW